MVECKVSPPTSAQTEKNPGSKDVPANPPQKVAPSEPTSVGVYGMVKWYNCKFNYGFISRLDNKQDLFVHRNGIKKCNPKKFKSLMDGDIVMFDVYESEKGAEARNVTGPEGKPARPSRYAKFRPWYLEILRKTRAITLDDQNGDKNDNFRNRQNYNRYKRQPQTFPKPKDPSSASSELKKAPQAVESNSSTAPESPVTNDPGYASKSPSENDKRQKRDRTRSYHRDHVKAKTPTSNSQCHSCSMCEKATTAVEV
ncbi:Nuclease-sensitive element-binding protein 1 [Thelohanellus kitauei]|uniref:Nuclease-sensitive element-binding protein 1 n=1 Tax=Thelohanellus kitauei TaxID=669202 RepID=A0A0C2NIS4_THEKT|nr:Nuclease-sensitive element-binding protein 1 [Thelohanellus kitauei]